MNTPETALNPGAAASGRFLGWRTTVGTVFGVSLLFALWALPETVRISAESVNLSVALRAPELSGSPYFLLGTDQLGRSVLARIVMGARYSLLIGLASASIAAVVGTSLGLLSGIRQRMAETVILRTVDAQVAMPFLVIAIAVVAVVGASLPTLITTLAVAGWPGFTRLVHSTVIVVKHEKYIEAATLLGMPRARIVLRHIMPHLYRPIIVLWTFVVARTIIVESGLAFLGLGLAPPTPTWGGMISDGRTYLETSWWISLYPTIAVVLAIFLINQAGSRLRSGKP
jgi:peptide/nickel transport system permease protein